MGARRKETIEAGPAAVSAAPSARVLIGAAQEDLDAATRALELDGRFVICGATHDAAQAVAAALTSGPDICLLDIALPGGGLAAAWEVTSRLPGTRVVMLASDPEDEDELLRAVAVGVSGYVLRGDSFDWLASTLSDVQRGVFALPRHLTGRVVQHLRSTEPRRRALLGTAAHLTSREWEILDLIARGLSTKQVARELTLSPSAVRVHIAAAVHKLGVESRADAVALLHRSEAMLDDNGDVTLHVAI